MTLLEIAAGIFLGNMLAVSLVCSVAWLAKKDNDDAPWMAIAGAALPLLWFIAIYITAVPQQ